MKVSPSFQVCFAVVLLALFANQTQAQAPESLSRLLLKTTPKGSSYPFQDNDGSLGFVYFDEGVGIYLGRFSDGTTVSFDFYSYNSSGAYGVAHLEYFADFGEVILTLRFDQATSGSYTLALATNSSAKQIGTFLVSTLVAPQTVTLLTPTNGSTIQERRPQFSWTPSEPLGLAAHIFLQRNAQTYMDDWIYTYTNWIPTSDLPAGSYTWWVQTGNGAASSPWSQGFTFTIPAAVPGRLTAVSPNGVTVSNSTIRYLWSVDTNTAWYHLCVFKDDKAFCDQWYFTNATLMDPASGNFGVDIMGHGGGAYRWWVQGWSRDGLGPWSSPGTFTVPNLTPGPVTLLSPRGTQDNLSAMEYTWTVEPKATWYEFALVKNSKLIVDQWYMATNLVTELESGTVRLDQPGHAGGTYQWWVRAWSPDGFGPWSTSLSYQVPVQVPAAPNLIAPSGTVDNTQPVSFQWNSVPGARWYRIYLVKDAFVFWPIWVQGTTWIPEWDLQRVPGNYQWRVMGWNEDGNGAWSQPLTFTVNSSGTGN